MTYLNNFYLVTMAQNKVMLHLAPIAIIRFRCASDAVMRPLCSGRMPHGMRIIFMRFENLRIHYAEPISNMVYNNYLYG